MSKARDTQVGGSHYVGKVQPFDLAMSSEYNYFQSHALSYLHRYGKKGTPVQDLQKIKQLCDLEIERLESQS